MRDLQRDVDGLPRRNRSAVDARAQRFTFQELADQERSAVGVADVVDRQQVRMIEHPGCARFLLEALHPLAIAHRDGGENLDGNITAQARVPGAVDGAHTSFAEPRHDPVRPHHGVLLKEHESMVAGAGGERR